MPEKTSCNEWLKQDLGSFIDGLELSALQKHSLHSRWLDQVLWMEKKAALSQRWYYILRMLTIVGGVLIPTAASLKAGDACLSGLMGWLTILIGLVVAISAAVEGFFRFGERWRHYRRTVELLKVEGWLFFQLNGPYQSNQNHAQAYPAFAARVEELLKRDVEVYVTEIAKEKQKKEEQEKGPAAT